MDDDLDRLVYVAMSWNTPLDDDHAQRLLDALDVGAARTVLDLGCGWGELLLRAVASGPPGCRGTGVDNDAPLLARGREAAQARGLQDAVRFVHGDATAWRQDAEVVLCIGAAHAWPGGAAGALRDLHRLLAPGGRLLFSDGIWAAPPTEAALEIFGHDVLTRDKLTAAATAAGWRAISVSEASQREWDDFEARYRAGREQWARAHPEDPRAAPLAAQMAERREEYETVYRGVLGFAYLVLGNQ